MSRFILEDDLKDNSLEEEIEEENINNNIYAITSLQTKTARNGDKVSSFVLRNKQGFLNAVLFGICDCKEGDIVEVSGTMGYYNNAPQINIYQIKTVKPTEEYINKVLPSCKTPVEVLKSDVKILIDQIKDKALAEFIDRLIGSQPKFYTAPAAKRIHHATIGGLAEHSIQVAKIASSYAPYYNCNADIVIAGGLLHDIGKICEFDVTGNINYSNTGRLLGHSHIGTQMVVVTAIFNNTMEDKHPAISESTVEDILHIILSHHGEQEYGAAVKPATVEALLVHLADYMDSKMDAAIEQIKNDSTPGDWTSYDHATETAYRKNNNQGLPSLEDLM